MPKNVVIIVRNEQKGLYASIGYQLSRVCDVTFVTDSRDAKNVIRNIFGEKTPKVLIEPDARNRYPARGDTMSRAKANETLYGLRYALLISMDRGLGRGYLSNVRGYPRIGRENWLFLEKVESLNKTFEFFEGLIDSSVILISKSPEMIPNIICTRQGVSHFHLLQARYGERMIWSDGERFVGSNFEQTLAKFLQSLKGQDPDSIPEDVDYELDLPGAQFLSEHGNRVTIASTSKAIILKLLYNVKRLILGRIKKNSVGFFAWIPVIVRRLFHYRFIELNGQTPTTFSDRRLVYFPLHMEPERTLLQYCYEFNNVFEAITLVSKALPSDVVLVLKEHPAALGHRDNTFYKNISNMGNVVFSKPHVASWNWIKRAELTVTMAGTAGEEAVHLRKPVMTYGRGQRINSLSTVFEVRAYEEVRSAIDHILIGGLADAELERSSIALAQATKQLSFEMPGYSNRYKSDQLELHESSIALKQLLKVFPKSLGIDEKTLNRHLS